MKIVFEVEFYRFYKIDETVFLSYFLSGFFFYSAKMHFFLRLYPIFPRKPGGVLFASLEVRRLTKLLVSHGQKKISFLAKCQNFVLLLTRLFFREKGRKYCV